MGETMRAVVADGYGPPEVLTVRELPVPEPGPGQIQVRIRAAALNPADLRLVDGVLRAMAPLEFPHVPGMDFAGTVTAIGAGVTRFAVGDEVFGLGHPRAAPGMAALVATPPSLTTGTMAQYAVFEAETPGIELRPAGLDAAHAASLPVVGLTALPVLRAGDFAPGDTVLVVGATGGVGSAVVPILAAAKVNVFATAGPDDDRYVRDLGAAGTIDHHAGDLAAETRRRYPDGIAAVVNLALPGNRLGPVAGTIRPGGRLLNIAYPKPEPADLDRTDLTVETLYTSAGPGDLAELAARALDGSLPDAVSRRYRLDDGARAHRDLIGLHTRGKLLVVVD